MSDNTQLNPGINGDIYRSIDKSGVKTQVVTLDLGGSGAESLVSNGMIVVIESAHNHIHSGRYFSGSIYDSAVLNNGVINMLIQTAANTAHVNITGVSGGDSILQMYEGATFSAAGASVTLTNHNRQSNKATDLVVTSAPTLTGDGTQMNGTLFAPGGTKAQSSGGSAGFGGEFVLNNNSVYLIRLTNISGSTKAMNLIIDLYQPAL